MYKDLNIFKIQKSYSEKKERFQMQEKVEIMDKL